jgi:hypothetical protein
MKSRQRAIGKSGGKAGTIAMTSAAPKRVAVAKKSTAPAKKAKAAPSKKAAASAKKPAAAKKAPASAKKPAPAPAAGPRLATPIPSGQPGSKPAAKPVAPTAAKPATAMARPAAGGAQSLDERRKAATRKFFARLRSLEAIVGADLRKRGSLVLMQAVDQWYSEAISATATDVSITNAAKAVIAHL